MSNMRARAISHSEQNETLQTKYYCEVENDEVRVSMEMRAKSGGTSHRLPLCYSLVIDVSGSMGNSVGQNQTESLLDRIKVFAQFAVQAMSNEDYLAITIFSNSASVVLPMTKLNKDGKERAINALKSLQSGGGTNLGEGLTSGLRAIERAKRSTLVNQMTRDCIILFTDGEANQGITDADELVRHYESIQNSMDRTGCIPLSAFTIGNYQPDTLVKLAAKLGSEAFYWLDENQTFEGDMLIPLIMRSTTHTTDVHIQMQCMNQVLFRQDRISNVHLMSNRRDRLTYFVHSLPNSTEKTIPVYLCLPGGNRENLKGMVVLVIDITYNNEQMEKVTIQDKIILSGSSLYESYQKQPPSNRGSISDAMRSLMQSISSFSVFKNNILNSWTEAKKSLLKNAQVECRRLGAEIIEKAKNMQTETLHLGDLEALRQRNIQEMDETTDRLVTILGNNSSETNELRLKADDLKVQINAAHVIVQHSKPSAFARLSAMSSSIQIEMPNTGGVFAETVNQPYRTPGMEKKLANFKEIIEQAKKEGSQAKNVSSSSFEGISNILSQKDEEIQEAMDDCGVDDYIDLIDN